MLESKSLKHLKFTLPPKRLALRLWGNWGPQSPKQKKNASVWQAKIKAGLAIKSQARLRCRRDAVIAKGDVCG